MDSSVSKCWVPGNALGIGDTAHPLAEGGANRKHTGSSKPSDRAGQPETEQAAPEQAGAGEGAQTRGDIYHFSQPSCNVLRGPWGHSTGHVRTPRGRPGCARCPPSGRSGSSACSGSFRSTSPGTVGSAGVQAPQTFPFPFSFGFALSFPFRDPPLEGVEARVEAAPPAIPPGNLGSFFPATGSLRLLPPCPGWRPSSAWRASSHTRLRVLPGVCCLCGASLRSHPAPRGSSFPFGFAAVKQPISSRSYLLSVHTLSSAPSPDGSRLRVPGIRVLGRRLRRGR